MFDQKNATAFVIDITKLSPMSEIMYDVWVNSFIKLILSSFITIICNFPVSQGFQKLHPNHPAEAGGGA